MGVGCLPPPPPPEATRFWPRALQAHIPIRGPTAAAHRLCQSTAVPGIEPRQAAPRPLQPGSQKQNPASISNRAPPPFLPRKKVASRCFVGRLGFHDNRPGAGRTCDPALREPMRRGSPETASFQPVVRHPLTEPHRPPLQITPVGLRFCPSAPPSLLCTSCSSSDCSNLESHCASRKQAEEEGRGGLPTEE